MLKSTTSGWFSRMASRSSRSLRNHGLASSAVSPIGAIVMRPAQAEPLEPGDEVGERSRVVG